jgi:pyrroline-5-carboxylate reductase
MSASVSDVSSPLVVLVGAGNMGGAMLSGWLKNGVPGASVLSSIRVRRRR